MLSKTLTSESFFQVSVEFVDTQSYLYSKNKQMCEFWIRGIGHGKLESPRHSLPPNTTCLYHLQVNFCNWFYFDSVESNIFSYF